MLLDRTAFEQAGGLVPIRGAIIDDCALARRMKTRGPIWIGLTERVESLLAAGPGDDVGVPHGIELPVRAMFGRNVGVFGGLAPVRKYLPDLLERTLAGRIDPGPVFDLTLPLDQVADGYRAMDERRAIKVLLQP